ELGGSWEYAKNVTLLKEGYVLSLDSVYIESTPATDILPGKHIRIANFSLYMTFGYFDCSTNISDTVML
ncbi:MAG: hypothetical protein Q8N79_01310, partial [Candidatus Methanoperedens sp.]|nr:hypothetical protein [Candidatus Methanoperedens sp.]